MTTTQDALFGGTDAATLAAQRRAYPSATQWRMESLQVVNWGGFSGPHELRLHHDGTLVSGGSGTGKSTLLDAYTALMMPTGVAFNGASNDAGTGRARNELGGQRTLLTYLRGKRGVNDESGGATSENLMRGKGSSTWGAVAAVFVRADESSTTDEESFTALRLYFVPATATDSNAIAARMATVPGKINLKDLEPAMLTYTSEKKLAAVITSTWPSAKTHPQYSQFSNRLFTQLGIGANGDGRHALDLLARIQAGRSFNSVNALYRQLVLDTPATFKEADNALAHYDTVAGDLAKMDEAEKKHQVLKDLPVMHEAWQTAKANIADLDSYGLTAPKGVTTRASVWALRVEDELLAKASRHAHDQHIKLAEEAEQAKIVAADRRLDLETMRDEYLTSGGKELAGLTDQIAAAAGEKGLVESRRRMFSDLAVQVDTPFNSRADFDGIQSDAQKFMEGIAAAQDAYEKQRDQIREPLRELSDRKTRLEAEYKQLDDSGTRIRGRLAEARKLVAARLGMDQADLPYVAELIDLRNGEERWRTAVETVLGGDARRIVVPAGSRHEIRRILNEVTTGHLGQIGLIDGIVGRDLWFPLDGADSPDQRQRVVGKLAFAESPYTGWLQHHLANGDMNAVCVERPDDLDGGGFRVTLTGQTRRGIRSSIGRSGRDDIIGFSNQADMEAIETELCEISAAIGEITIAQAQLREQYDARSRRQTAYATIGTYTWDSIDTDAATNRLATLQARKEQLRGADDRLRALEDEIENLETTYNDAQVKATKANTLASDAGKLWKDLVKAKDQVVTRLGHDEYDEEYELSPTQEAHLLDVYATASEGTEGLDPIQVHDRLGQTMLAVFRSLTQQLSDAQAEQKRCEQDMVKTFTVYHAQWEPASVGTGLESYPDYLRILNDIEATGLYQNRGQWQRAVSGWLAEDLVPLSHSMRTEVDAIRKRVDPINQILRTIPFGARRGRLKLKVDDVHQDSVTRFKRQLRSLASKATTDLSFEETRRLFEQLGEFMAHLRAPRDSKYVADKSDRDRLLDVRRHVEVYAIAYPDPDGLEEWAPQEFRQLGTASGGESQELIAFIIGSALRFRLGDEDHDRPRFAPVFLDEGFVKADSQFAGRAVSAWRELKFQIIIGAPEDKFTGLERHMDSFVLIQKDEESGNSFIDYITGHEDERSTDVNGQHEYVMVPHNARDPFGRRTATDGGA